MKHKQFLGVLIPDKASGDAYAQIFDDNQVASPVFRYYASIKPRVLVDRINPDPQIAKDLAASLLIMHHNGCHLVLIACNTLQLWLPEALAQLPISITRDLKIITSMEAINWKYGKKNSLVWLGTQVFIETITQLGYSTLLSKNEPQVQSLVQEIIWRVKAVYGMEYKTAGDILNITDVKILKSRTKKLVNNLQKCKIKRVVLGCTELPLIFTPTNYKKLQTINPANVMFKYIEHLKAVR